MRQYSIVILFLLVAATATQASSNLCPMATQENIYGVWEAIDLQLYRVFRLELNRDGTSVLTRALPGGHTTAAYLTSMSLESGEILLGFQAMDKRVIGRPTVWKGVEYVTTGVRIIGGIARVCRISGWPGPVNYRGTMDVEFVLEPSSPSPRAFELQFIKLQNRTLGDDIIQMEKSAADAATRAKAEMGKHQTE